MTPREGLARIKAVYKTLGEPETWPPYLTGRLTKANPGCILQRAAGLKRGGAGFSVPLGFPPGFFVGASGGPNLIGAYDTRNRKRLLAAIAKTERWLKKQKKRPRR